MEYIAVNFSNATRFPPENVRVSGHLDEESVEGC